MNAQQKREALEAILKRPRMYVGNTPHLFTAVRFFLDGLETGLTHHEIDPAKFPELPEGFGFRSWIAKEVKGNHLWEEELLEECDGDEEKAFEAYRELILEYLRSCAGGSPPQSNV